jgi:hypothetical protein
MSQNIRDEISTILRKEKLSQEEADRLYQLIVDLPEDEQWGFYFDETELAARRLMVASGFGELAGKLRLFASF